jgi:LacI family transcriptional regulator
MKAVFVSLGTSREYERGLLRGISRYNSLHRRWRIDLSAGEDLRSQISDLKFSARDVDGVIMPDRRGSPALLKRGIPIVFVSVLHKDIRHSHRVVSDDEAIGRMTAAHLLERGLRHFAFVGYDGLYWSRQRQESFSQALADAGRACAVFEQARDLRLRVWRKEQKALAEWLKALPRPVGVMACNDDRARQVADACAMVDLAVPEDVAILGVDNDELVCNFSNPPISSISLDLEDAGYRAAILLDGMMAAKDSPGACSADQILVSPASVVVRRSTEVAIVQDSCVMQALRFIRENSDRPVQVDDVVRQVAISRRSLFDRFRRAVGCTVCQYIKRTRAARIEELLLGTSHPIGEIAAMLGFPDSDHVAQYFRSIKGMNPGVFRARHAHRR